MKIKISQLQKLYYEKKAKELAEYLQISETTLRKILKENKIKLKGQGIRPKIFKIVK